MRPDFFSTLLILAAPFEDKVGARQGLGILLQISDHVRNLADMRECVTAVDHDGDRQGHQRERFGHTTAVLGDDIAVAAIARFVAETNLGVEPRKDGLADTPGLGGASLG
jgi:hypothetical protein